ncbi:peptidylprolyl isomerase [Pontixanthobacter sp. CEM42]|uniref:peptidylprolyl isomerase n=1 Tax=Pontixanthobacter sp. CEM42 TaxID=2792077 RepID=UPI001AE07C18|nr:peptidylprolyl isomerase [Pontixanthobacter sp. CEM42]
MKKQLLLAATTFALTLPVTAQETEPAGAPSPSQIVDAAPEEEWVSIPAEDLLIMELSPDANDEPRYVTIQLMPAPFSQGWVENIRTFARAKWYDGITVNRVQDNYVVQWGDPNYDNPEAEGEAKPLPEGLKVMDESEYVTSKLLSIPDPRGRPRINYTLGAIMIRNAMISKSGTTDPSPAFITAMEEALENPEAPPPDLPEPDFSDRYSGLTSLVLGWPIAGNEGGETKAEFWPVHCYGMVGVGRNYSPDTGSGAELYTVIGHAPRHLDRNIALVGRIIEGMEHLSSLPRGSGALGFYTKEEEGKRTPILSVRVASDLPEDEQPLFEYLSTEGETFAKYAEARANRRDPFFLVPAGGADICNIPVPVRHTPNG